MGLPRPPRLEPTERRIQVFFEGAAIADTRGAYRVLETSHPPVYYLPREDIAVEHLLEAPGFSFCEWKGRARYVGIQVGGRRLEKAGWYYPEPSPGFEVIGNHIAFYPDPMDRCLVDGEAVKPQPGGFYGGWITPDVVGPFKGDTGTDFW